MGAETVTDTQHRRSVHDDFIFAEVGHAIQDPVHAVLPGSAHRVSVVDTVSHIDSALFEFIQYRAAATFYLDSSMTITWADDFEMRLFPPRDEVAPASRVIHLKSGELEGARRAVELARTVRFVRAPQPED